MELRNCANVSIGFRIRCLARLCGVGRWCWWCIVSRIEIRLLDTSYPNALRIFQRKYEVSHGHRFFSYTMDSQSDARTHCRNDYRRCQILETSPTSSSISKSRLNPSILILRIIRVKFEQPYHLGGNLSSFHMIIYLPNTLLLKSPPKSPLKRHSAENM